MTTSKTREVTSSRSGNPGSAENDRFIFVLYTCDEMIDHLLFLLYVDVVIVAVLDEYKALRRHRLHATAFNRIIRIIDIFLCGDIGKDQKLVFGDSNYDTDSLCSTLQRTGIMDACYLWSEVA